MRRFRIKEVKEFAVNDELQKWISPGMYEDVCKNCEDLLAYGDEDIIDMVGSYLQGLIKMAKYGYAEGDMKKISIGDMSLFVNNHEMFESVDEFLSVNE